MVISIQVVRSNMTGPCKYKYAPLGLWEGKGGAGKIYTGMCTHTHIHIPHADLSHLLPFTEVKDTKHYSPFTYQSKRVGLCSGPYVLKTKSLKDCICDFIGVHNKHEMVKTRNHKVLPFGFAALPPLYSCLNPLSQFRST